MPPLTCKPVNLPPLACDNPDPQPEWNLKFEFLIGTPDDLVAPGSDWKSLYAQCQAVRLEEWHESVRAFEAAPQDFHNAYHYLNEHPMFYFFYGAGQPAATRLHERYLEHAMGVQRCVGTSVYRRGGATWVMLEAGEHEWPRQCEPSEGVRRDTLLTVRATSYEAAVIALAAKVHTYYGNDRQHCDDHTPGVVHAHTQ